MAVFAISDLHLSLHTPKPMDIFGPVWENHAEKLEQNWRSAVTEDDVVLMPGDTSWAIRLSDAVPDLDFVAGLPGRKALIRGNHDYWWQRQATSRLNREYGPGMVFLQGMSVMLGDIGVTGTRGWRVETEYAGLDINKTPQMPQGQSEKILQRELEYLQRGLSSIPEDVRLKIALLHYPPFDERLQPNEFGKMLAEHAVDIVLYGHIHLGLGNWFDGDLGGVRHRLVSADMVNFSPQIIVP